MKFLAFVGSVVFFKAIAALSYDTDVCDSVYAEYELSSNFNETIGHAIHSLNTIGLKLFNPLASEVNNIPTVNHNLKSKNKVLDHAPEEVFGNDFSTFSMNVIDKILSNVGVDDDGLGSNWTPVERIAHKFHMFDTWNKIYNEYSKSIKYNEDAVSSDLCDCLLNTHDNGIYNAVSWIAHHYETGNPITLLNKPIPKLTDYASWKVWKQRLLYYYDDKSLKDAAYFMHCATKNFKL